MFSVVYQFTPTRAYVRCQKMGIWRVTLGLHANNVLLVYIIILLIMQNTKMQTLSLSYQNKTNKQK